MTRPAPFGSATIVGGGPAGLMAAEVLARPGVAVTVHEHMPSVGRKLLLAGRSGLNITHSEPIDETADASMAGRPADSRQRSEPLIRATCARGARRWARRPSSDRRGRVFPASFRATPLLRAWLRRLEQTGCDASRFAVGGWGGPRHAMESRCRSDRCSQRSDGATSKRRATSTVFALGGASWPRVGSDGGWVDVFRRAGSESTTFVPRTAAFVSIGPTTSPIGSLEYH